MRHDTARPKALTVRNLTLTPDRGVTVLAEIDLGVMADEWLCVVGVSGSGKTRLLRAIAGLETPASGAIELPSGAWADWVSPAEQAHDLPGRRTVRDWLLSAHKSLPRSARLAVQDEVAERVSAAMRLLELDAGDRRIEGLSEGERHRLVLAAALVRGAQVVLWDDVLAGLDIAQRARIRMRLRAEHAVRGGIWIWATSDAAEALALGWSSRVAVLGQGALRQVAVGEQLIADPAHRDVSEFLGANFLEGRLDMREGELVFSFADGASEGIFGLQFLHGAPPRVPGAEPGRGSLSLGILPHAVRLIGEGFEEFGILEPALPSQKVLPDWAASQETPWSASGGLPESAVDFRLKFRAGVLGLERTGATDAWLWVELGSGAWRVRAPADLTARAGDKVWLELEREAICWFDAQGARIPIETGGDADTEKSEPLGHLALEEPATERGLVIERSKPAAAAPAKKIQ